MRSIWKGHIRFSLVTIPVTIFNGIETKTTVSFNQLHKEDNGRVGYVKVCKTCDQKMEKDDIVKGYQYEKDQYVIIESEELSSLKLKSTSSIDIEAFVDMNEVHPSRFDSVYYVGPQGEVAQGTFSLLRQVLENTGKAGIGKVVLRDRETPVLLAPLDKGIVMYKLRYPYEIRSVKNVPDLEEETIKVDDAQMKLAEQLVDSLSKPFEEVVFEDKYRDAVMEMVNAKVEGREVVVMAEAAEEPVVDIMSALKASIEEAKKLKKGA